MKPILLITLSSLTLGACATVGGEVGETAAELVGDTYTATLTGSAEVPGPGDADGSGMAEVTIVEAVDDLCYDLDVSGIAPASAAHIHRGAAGESGPPVVTLAAPTDGSVSGCINAQDAILVEIKSTPSGFYVNVHNADFPAGAIRGQLGQ